MAFNLQTAYDESCRWSVGWRVEMLVEGVLAAK
jgi:hypothetical protein